MDEIQIESTSVEVNEQPETSKKSSSTWAIIIAILFIGLIIAGIVILSNQPQEVTSKVRTFLLFC